MSQSMNLNSIAVIIFNSTASHAAARLQRRFRLLSCRTIAASELPFAHTATGLCIATVWDVSNDEGTALEKKMLAALNLVLGDETGAQPGSVRGDCPAGTVIAGPLIDAKLVKQLQLVPPDPPPEPADEPPAAPTKPSSSKSDDIDYGPKPSELLRGPMKGEKAPSLGASVPPGQSPQILNLTIDRTKDGIDLQIVRIQPPTDGGKAAGGEKAAAKGDAKKEKKEKGGKGEKGAAPPPSKEAAKPKPQPPAAAAASPPPAPVAATIATPTTVAASKSAPNYRSTSANAAQQAVLRHAVSGKHAEAAYLYHSGPLPWHAAVASAM